MKNRRKENPIEDQKQEDIQEGGYPKRDTQYKLDELAEFFADELTEIIEISGVSEWLKEELRKDLDGIWGDLNAILEAYNSKDGYVHGERSISDIIEELDKETGKVYMEMLDAEWKGLTVEQAKEKLQKGSTYVALLDEKDLVMREPYPAIANTTTKVTTEITEKDRWSTDTTTHPRRELKIHLDPPIKRQSLDETPFDVSCHVHAVRPQETKAVIIQT